MADFRKVTNLFLGLLSTPSPLRGPLPLYTGGERLRIIIPTHLFYI